MATELDQLKFLVNNPLDGDTKYPRVAAHLHHIVDENPVVLQCSQPTRKSAKAAVARQLKQHKAKL